LAASGSGVPGYEILSELGRGGMGVVYKARHLGLNRLVALKMILAGQHVGSSELARFRLEAEAVAHLQHPHIVQIYEIGETNGLPYFSLELIEGGSLAGKLQGTPLPAKESARLVETLARAMQHAHERGIIHRDLKPANVLMSGEWRVASGGRDSSSGARYATNAIPKITDFGLAKRLDHGHGQTQSGSILGTPSYMAPEQADGKNNEVGPAADIYALGAILYELLTGRPPFRGPTPLDTVLQVVSEEPVAPARLAPKLPRDLETICLKCLQKEPRQRYPTALALAEDLAAFLEDRPIRARPVGQVERGWRWCKRNPALATAAAAVVLALVIGSVISAAFGIQANVSAEQARSEADKARLAQDAAEQAKTDKQRQVIRLLAANGNRLLRGGDPLAALPWFVEARRLDPEDLFQRTRLEGALRLMPSIIAFWQHREAVTDVAVSPDDRRAVSGSSDRTARLWDLRTGRPIGPTLEHKTPVLAVAFSPDGQRVATGGGAYFVSSELRLWDAATGQELPSKFKSMDAVVFVGFTADGKKLVSGEYGAASSSLLGKLAPKALSPLMGGLASPELLVQLWDVKTGALLRKLTLKWGGKPVPPDVELVVHAASARVLVVDGKQAHIVDLATGKTVGTSWKHTSRIDFARLSHDGTRALTVSGADSTGKVRELATGKEATFAVAYNWSAKAAAFNERGEVALAFYDGALTRYRPATGQAVENTLREIGTKDWYPVFSSDGQFLAGVNKDGTVRIWDVSLHEAISPPLRHGTGITAGAFAADGRRLMVGGGDGSVRVWDLAQEEPPFRVFSMQSVRHNQVQFDEAGQGLMLGEGTFVRFDPGTGKEVEPEAAKDPSVRLMVLSPDQARVALADGGGQVRVRDIATRKELLPQPLPASKHFVLDMAFSGDGKHLLTLVADNDSGYLRFMAEVQLWDLTTGKPVTSSPLRFQGNGEQPLSGIACIAFSPTSRHFALGCGGMAEHGIRFEAQIYDALTCKAIGAPLSSTPGQIISHLEFSPDGNSLAALSVSPLSSGEASVWDVATGQRRLLVPLTSEPLNCKYNPASSRLAIAAGLEVQLWDLETGGLVHVLPHPESVGQVRYGPNGRVLFTVARREVYLWDAVSGESLRPPVSHNSGVASAALAPDNRFLLTATVHPNDSAVRCWDLSGGAHGFDVQERLARVLSCQELDGTTAVLVPLQRRMEDWQVLRAQAASALVPTEDAIASWHDRQGSRALNSDSFATAARQFEHGVSRHPASAFGRFIICCCYLGCGDQAGVERHAKELSRIATAYPDLYSVEWALRSSLMGPAPYPDPGQVLQLAERLKNHQDSPWWPLAYGLAHFRLGHLDLAAQALEQARTRKDRTVFCGVVTDLLLAMTRRQQGRTEEAKKLFAAARATLTSVEKEPFRNETWIDRIHTLVLMREAQELFREP
jgi:WD40 repeat protein